MKKLFLTIASLCALAAPNGLQGMMKPVDEKHSENGVFGQISQEQLACVEDRVKIFCVAAAEGKLPDALPESFFHKKDLTKTFAEVGETLTLIYKSRFLAFEAGNEVVHDQLEECGRTWNGQLSKCCQWMMRNGDALLGRAMFEKVKAVKKSVFTGVFFWTIEHGFLKALVAVCNAYCNHIDEHLGGYLFQCIARVGCVEGITILTQRKRFLFFMTMESFPIYPALAFMDAARNGHTEVVAYLWKGWRKHLIVRFTNVQRALEEAAQAGQLAVVEWFIKGFNGTIEIRVWERALYKANENSCVLIAELLKKEICKRSTKKFESFMQDW